MTINDKIELLVFGIVLSSTVIGIFRWFLENTQKLISKEIKEHTVEIEEYMTKRIKHYYNSMRQKVKSNIQRTEQLERRVARLEKYISAVTGRK